MKKSRQWNTCETASASTELKRFYRINGGGENNFRIRQINIIAASAEDFIPRVEIIKNLLPVRAKGLEESGYPGSAFGGKWQAIVQTVEE
ncbi:hypothetical protein [Cellvibrio polysaccharolyticus]|uniref:hypothetical protein n=1 Tax=Cellvibrio polysaccharolyticus TaxID=2082724 RepID=UPI00187F1337|nr:hypothetical protein [Cellvibrio polysaccharolyticus]